jgi:hypothetical protein
MSVSVILITLATLVCLAAGVFKIIQDAILTGQLPGDDLISLGLAGVLILAIIHGKRT